MTPVHVSSKRLSSVSSRWRREVERLYIQLHLHMEDSLVYFNIQRTRLYRFLEQNESGIASSGAGDLDISKVLTSKMREVRFQLSKGSIDAPELLLEQQGKLLKAIADLQQCLYMVRNVAPMVLVELSHDIEMELTEYRTKFSLFRLRLKLSSSKNMNKTWNNKKRELSQKLRTLHVMLENGRQEAVDSLKHFYLELTD